MCEICRAVEVLEARRNAALGEGHDLDQGYEKLRPLLIGSGLTLEQVAMAATARTFPVTDRIEKAVENGDDRDEFTSEAIASAWIEGLLLGQILRDNERKRQAVIDRYNAMPKGPEKVLAGLKMAFGDSITFVEVESLREMLADSRPPLWTMNSQGAREAERDRRRRPRGTLRFTP